MARDEKRRQGQLMATSLHDEPPVLAGKDTITRVGVPTLERAAQGELRAILRAAGR
jgi:hypothetical protein